MLAEDNDNDVELTRQGYRRTKLLLNLHRVKNGVECLAFLGKQGEYANAPTPDLILPDLNMPKMDGRQVLVEMVADKNLEGLPVVVLTTSEQEEEICSPYIVKPVDFDQFLKVVRTMAEYWFTVVVLRKETRQTKPKHAGAQQDI